MILFRGEAICDVCGRPGWQVFMAVVGERWLVHLHCVQRALRHRR